MNSFILRKTAILAVTILAGWSANTDAASEGISIIFTSLEDGMSVSGYSCTISAEVSNDTANHLDLLTANTPMFDINIKNLRAYAQYDFTFHADKSCPEVVTYIRSIADFSTIIDSCIMPGVREGDCLRMVRISSTL